MTFDPSQIQRSVPLAPRTTIGIGGPARFFYKARTSQDLIAVYRWAQSQDLPILLLGGGSNLLLPDTGFPGLVLSIHITGRTSKTSGEREILEIGAGEDWDQLVAYCVTENLAGVECLAGIPGKVGSAPIQNIGAYGQELADSLVEVKALDLQTMKPVCLSREQCGFAYRNSIFKSSQAGRYVVLGITLALVRGGSPCIEYPDLRNRVGENADLGTVRRTVLEIRREKSMVADETDPNARSCGSFFTNPILNEPEYAAFKIKAPQQHPHYPAGKGKTKLAAAWLIEQSGFHKGYTRGNVGLSQKHCLAIINRGGGTYSEVQALAEEIQSRVQATFGVALVPEPVIVNSMG